MAVEYAKFVDEFPEYGKLSPGFVRGKISDAEKLFSKELFGDLYDSAVKYQAAILCASSPHGRPQAMTKNKETPYQERLNEILRSVPARGLLIRPC